MKIGVSELIVVLIVALLVLGPDKLPRYARKLGAALAEFRKASDAATREIRENVVEPLEEAQRPLREAMEPVEELNRAVKGNLKEVTTSLEQLGKAPRKASAPEAQPVAATESVTPQPVAATPENITATQEAAPVTPEAQAVAATESATPEPVTASAPESVAV